MKRQVSAAVVAVCMSAAVANGQGQVLSFYNEGGIHTSPAVIGQVPAEGFVITDVTISGDPEGGTYFLYDDNGTDLTKVFAIKPSSNLVYTLASGIPIAGGSTIKITNNTTNPAFGVVVTVSGYVPCPNPCTCFTGMIPVMSEWGLVAFALLLLSGGTVAMRRKRQLV